MTRALHGISLSLSASVTIFILAYSVASTRADTSTTFIDVGPKPESVTRGFDGKLYVTLMGETRKDGDGDGRIVMLDNDTPRSFADGLNDPKGLVFAGERLITADFTRVWSIDAAGHKTLLASAKDFPRPPLYLNDVALEPGGRSVLVTDMGARDRMMGPNGLWPLGSAEAHALPAVGRVYRVDLASGTVTVAIDSSPLMPCPNGVDALTDGRIRIADFFKGNLLEWRDGHLAVLATGHRGADAILHDRTGKFLFVTEVLSGRVWQLAADGTQPTLLGRALDSAADAFVDDDACQLIVPDTKAGRLVYVPFGALAPPQSATSGH